MLFEANQRTTGGYKPYLWPKNPHPGAPPGKIVEDYDDAFTRKALIKGRPTMNVMRTQWELGWDWDRNGDMRSLAQLVADPIHPSLALDEKEPLWNRALGWMIHLLASHPCLKVFNDLEGIGSEWVRPAGGAREALQAYLESTHEAPIHIQYGRLHAGLSPSLIAEHLGPNEYPLDLLYCLAFIHRRIMDGTITPSQLPEINIDCPGSEYSYKANGEFLDCPRVELRPGQIFIDWNFVRRTRSRHGCGTIYIPPAQ